MASRHHQLAHSGIASGISIALAALFAYAPAHAQTPPPAPAGEVQRKRAKLELIVFRAFPEADAYSGIKRDFTQSQRLAIEQQLPFKVHFNDLGKHDLLVTFRGRRPVGLVYCRSEEAEWGLTELAWHMTLGQRVVGFKFLRGRNRHIKSLELSSLATDLGGAGFPQVAKLLAIHEKKNHTQRDTSLVSIERTTLRWAIDRNMRVLVAQPTEERCNVALRKACSQLKGRKLSEPPTANLRLSALAAVLGAVVPDLEKGGQR